MDFRRAGRSRYRVGGATVVALVAASAWAQETVVVGGGLPSVEVNEAAIYGAGPALGGRREGRGVVIGRDGLPLYDPALGRPRSHVTGLPRVGAPGIEPPAPAAVITLAPPSEARRTVVADEPVLAPRAEAAPTAPPPPATTEPARVAAVTAAPPPAPAPPPPQTRAPEPAPVTPAPAAPKVTAVPAGPEIDREPPARAVAEPAPVVEPEPALEPAAEPEPVAEPEPEPEPETAAEPEPVAEPEPTTLAAAAPATAPTPPPQPATAALATPGGPFTVEFAAGGAELPSGVEEGLAALARQIEGDTAMRLQLKAYASAENTVASAARRLSLSRALAVRSFLIEEGVSSTRIDVRALGAKYETGPPDRVDVIVVR
jgi:outer membrane protein OmpA-like peptidoglycan-associated protein